MKKQFPPAWLAFLFLVAAVSLWSVMVFGTLAKISGWAGGLTPFDLRWSGYSQADAVAFLAALGDGGRNYYVNFQLKLFDTPYPALYALSRLLMILWLTKDGRASAGPFPRVWRILPILIAIAAAGFGYAENAVLHEVIRAGAAVSADLVATASTLTVVKSTLTSIADIFLVAFAILGIRRALRRGRATAGE